MGLLQFKRKGDKVVISDPNGTATKHDIEKVAKKIAEEKFEKALKKAKIPFKKR